MRRMGLAGLVFVVAVAVPGAAAPGATPAAGPAAGDGSARTGSLIALVRSPRIAGITESKRASLLDTAKSRISAVVDRSGVSAVRSIPSSAPWRCGRRPAKASDGRVAICGPTPR